MIKGNTLYNIFFVALLILIKTALWTYLNRNNLKIALVLGSIRLIPLILTTSATFASGSMKKFPSILAFLFSLSNYLS